MSLHMLPRWQHTDNGLTVQVGQRLDPVPEPIGDWLVGPGSIGLSGDPARDLLRVERRLWHMIAQLTVEIAKAEQRISTTPDGDELRNASRRRRRRPRAVGELRAALDGRAELVDTRETVRTVLEILHTYVIELDAPQGLLREAADGWRRRPDPPAGVAVFDDEDAFLEADPRRATLAGWGGTTIAGIEQFGFGWRRDGDEDDPAIGTPDDEVRRAGPWQIGYIERTGEIYGIRRCGYLPQQVWLLGAGFDTLRSARDVLLPIMHRITEPNSLILATETVHTAQIWQHSITHPRSLAPHRLHGDIGGQTDALDDAPEEAGR